MKKILQHHYGQAAHQPVPNQINSAPNHSVNNNATNTAPTSYTNQADIASIKQEEEEENMQQWIGQYNSPRESIRLTTERFPKTLQLSKDLSLPLGACILPYYSNLKDSIPVANFGTNPIIRCNACRAYISPFCLFQDGGSRWICNLCGRVEPTPSFYFCKLNDKGERLDKFTRPELYSGSFDIKAGAE